MRVFYNAGFMHGWYLSLCLPADQMFTDPSHDAAVTVVQTTHAVFHTPAICSRVTSRWHGIGSVLRVSHYGTENLIGSFRLFKSSVIPCLAGCSRWRRRAHGPSHGRFWAMPAPPQRGSVGHVWYVLFLIHSSSDVGRAQYRRACWGSLLGVYHLLCEFRLRVHKCTIDSGRR